RAPGGSAEAAIEVPRLSRALRHGGGAGRDVRVRPAIVGGDHPHHQQTLPRPRSSMTPRLSIIIVSYFVRQEVEDCLDALKKSDIPLEVFVVDNASTDGTYEMLVEKYGDWPALRSIRSPENVGLARANNIPLERLRGEYTLILNPDTIPTPRVLEQLVAYLDEHPDVGV